MAVRGLAVLVPFPSRLRMLVISLMSMVITIISLSPVKVVLDFDVSFDSRHQLCHVSRGSPHKEITHLSSFSDGISVVEVFNLV